MQKLTIALIGATGKVGSYILNQLLTAGYPVKALIRKPHAFTAKHPLLTVVEGNILNAADTLKLIEDCTAVVSALGQKPSEPLNALASAQNIIAAMEHFDINRYIFLAGLTIDAAGDQKDEATQAATNWMHQHYPETVADKQHAYELITKSNLAYTLVRVPMIETTDKPRGIHISLTNCPGDTIATTDLAAFITEQITDKRHLYKAPFVASMA